MSAKVQTTLTMRRNSIFIAALSVAITLAACGGGSTIDPLEIGDPERGREIFETSGGLVGTGCIICHSLDGSVQKPLSYAAPSLQGISERAGDRVPELSAVEYLRESIVDPDEYLVEGFRANVMPKGLGFNMSEEDIDAVIAFLLTQ